MLLNAVRKFEWWRGGHFNKYIFIYCTVCCMILVCLIYMHFCVTYQRHETLYFHVQVDSAMQTRCTSKVCTPSFRCIGEAGIIRQQACAGCSMAATASGSWVSWVSWRHTNFATRKLTLPNWSWSSTLCIPVQVNWPCCPGLWNGRWNRHTN